MHVTVTACNCRSGLHASPLPRTAQGIGFRYPGDS